MQCCVNEGVAGVADAVMKQMGEIWYFGWHSRCTVGSLLAVARSCSCRRTALHVANQTVCFTRHHLYRGRLEILVQNPPDGQELYWHNTRTVPKPYKGPREVRFEQDFSPDHDVKLALTR